MFHRLAICLLILGACACSATDEPEAETPIEGADRESVISGIRALVEADLELFEAAVIALHDVAPAADGWDAAAVDELRQRWRDARIVYHRIWAYAAMLFADEEAQIERLYDEHLNQQGHSFEGMHAIERILWADDTPQAVTDGEVMQSGYEVPRLPNNAASAAAFDALLDDLVNIAQKMRLAMMGSRTERAILITDTNKLVARSVIRSPAVSDGEALLYAKNRALMDEIIMYIAKNRKWIRHYRMKVALVNNPKTPTAIALRFLNYLRLNDLRAVARSKSAPPVVTKAAKALVKKKMN